MAELHSMAHTSHLYIFNFRVQILDEFSLSRLNALSSLAFAFRFRFDMPKHLEHSTPERKSTKTTLVCIPLDLHLAPDGSLTKLKMD